MATALDPEAMVARDRITDSLIGLVTLGLLYATTYFFLSVPLATAMMGVCAAWVVFGFTMRNRNPYLLRRLTYYSVASWVVLVLALNFANIS